MLTWDEVITIPLVHQELIQFLNWVMNGEGLSTDWSGKYWDQT